MKTLLKSLLPVFFILLMITACKEPYQQKEISIDANYLVVDGFINTSGVTNIQLTRTLRLSDKINTVKGELKAIVQIEGETSGIYLLTEKNNGLYSSASLNLPANQKYRLRIKTLQQKTYFSDYVAVKITPKIDSLSWGKVEKGVDIYANAHDDKKETRYYQWEFEEDWEIRSIAPSVYMWSIIPHGTVVAKRTNVAEIPLMYTCYKSSKSDVISVFSTVKLTDDVVFNFPLLKIPFGSDKLEARYSILAKQHALTKDAYEYLALMKKISESRGSIFDIQPSEIKGNIHNITDPSEMVIGFIQAATLEEKRMFITAAQIGKWDLSLKCGLTSVTNNADSLAKSGFDISVYTPADADATTVTLAAKECMDCRLRGGNNTKPSFW